MNLPKISKIILGIIAVLFIGVTLLALFMPAPAVAPEEPFEIVLEVSGEPINEDEFDLHEDEEFHADEELPVGE